MRSTTIPHKHIAGFHSFWIWSNRSSISVIILSIIESINISYQWQPYINDIHMYTISAVRSKGLSSAWLSEQEASCQCQWKDCTCKDCGRTKGLCISRSSDQIDIRKGNDINDTHIHIFCYLRILALHDWVGRKLSVSVNDRTVLKRLSGKQEK